MLRDKARREMQIKKHKNDKNKLGNKINKNKIQQ